MHLVRVPNFNAPARTIAQIRLKHAPKPRVVDHDDFKPRRRQSFNLPDDQRFAADGKQWLRASVSHRTHPLAAPGGEDHRYIESRQNV